MTRLLELLGVDEESVRWNDLAACKGFDTEWFYDEYERDIHIAEAADAACFSCPVQEACGKTGMRQKDEGQWGGIYLSNGSPDKIRNKHKTQEQRDKLEQMFGVKI